MPPGESPEGRQDAVPFSPVVRSGNVALIECTFFNPVDVPGG